MKNGQVGRKEVEDNSELCKWRNRREDGGMERLDREEGRGGIEYDRGGDMNARTGEEEGRFEEVGKYTGKNKIEG